MRTGLTKREKTTSIYFDEYGSMIECMKNVDKKNRVFINASDIFYCIILPCVEGVCLFLAIYKNFLNF